MSQNNMHLKKIFSRKETPGKEELRSYLEGDKTGATANQIEQALQDDPFLADAVEGMEMTGKEDFDHMLAQLRNRLDDRLAESNEEGKEIPFTPAPAEPESNPAPRRSPFKFISMAAAVVLLAVVGFFVLSSEPSLQDIANSHYQLYSASGDMSSDADLLQKASVLYQDGKYKQAAALYDQVGGPTPTLLAGHAYYQIENYALAAERFASLLELKSNIRKDAEYALAMTYLMQSREQEARDMLESIAAEKGHIYQSSAKDALKDMK